MGRNLRSRRILATPEAVFRAFTDPAIVADWMEASEIVDQRGMLDTAGSSYTLVISGPWRFRTIVVRSDPPVAHVTEGTGPLGAWYRMAATLTATDAGTDLEIDTEWRVLGPLGRWIDRFFVQSGPNTAANRELDRLVQIVSGDPAGIEQPLVPGGRRARRVAVARLREAGRSTRESGAA